jgi:DNA-binding transcriptional LysR family regulator
MSADPWMGVELRHLTALAMVATEGSFRGAADRLGYVQSAVSQQIAYLERRVGVRLLERSRGARIVRPTPAGGVLIDHLDEILARIQAARADLAAFQNQDGAPGTVRVGIHEQLGTRLLRAVLREFRERSAGIEIVLTERNSESELFGLVEEGAVDVAFGGLPLEPGPFETCELLDEPCVLLLPAGCVWADSGRPPTLERIAELRMIRHTSWRLMPAIEARFELQGLELDFAYESKCSVTVQTLVSAGLGAAIVPGLTVDPEDLTTQALDLGTVLPWHEVVLYWHRERRYAPAVPGFCEAARVACEAEHFQRSEERPRPLKSVPAPEPLAAPAVG